MTISGRNAAAVLRARSVMNWPEQIGVPLLIMHGANDQEVRAEDAMAFATPHEAWCARITSRRAVCDEEEPLVIVKLLIWAAGLTIVLALTAVVAGYALPQAHQASREAAVSAQPATVFATITEVARHPEWRSGVTNVEILGTAPLKWREDAGSDVITFEVVDARPPALLRVRIADPDLPFGGTWTYELAPEGPGTRVRVTEHGEVYNPVFRFMSRFVFGHTAGLSGLCPI